MTKVINLNEATPLSLDDLEAAYDASVSNFGHPDKLWVSSDVAEMWSELVGASAEQKFIKSMSRLLGKKFYAGRMLPRQVRRAYGD